MLLVWMWPALAAPEMVPLSSVDVVGREAASTVLPLRGGGEFDPAAHRGRVVVVSFWASWCGPCRLELPALSELAKQRSDVDFVAVNVDRDPSAAERFLRAVDVTVPVVWDSEASLLGEFSVLSMPTTFVVDAGGVVRHKKTGYSQERGLVELIGYIDEVAK